MHGAVQITLECVYVCVCMYTRTHTTFSVFVYVSGV